MLNRRGFLGGLLVALAAPAIIRPGLLMKIGAPKLVMPSQFVIPRFSTLAEAMASGEGIFDVDIISGVSPGILEAVTRRAFVPIDTYVL